MENILQSILLLTPEIILGISAISILLYGVFAKSHNINYISYSASFMMILACIIIIALPNNDYFSFNDALIITPLTQYGKLLIIVAAVSICCFFPAITANNKFITYETIPMLMLSTLGMMLTISSNNLLSLYLAIELMSLSCYVLVAINRNSLSSSEASMKYFVMGTLASCIYLLGASFLYGATGHIDFASIRDVATNLQQLDYVENPLLLTIFITGLVLVIVSFLFKVSAAPFHMWTPDVYQGAPWAITAFLASSPKLTALLTLARLLYGIFIPNDFNWSPIMVIVAVASMIIGGIGAIIQKNIKRIMAYSSISHIGFALMGLAVNNEEGVTAFIVYVTIYLTMNLGIFACFMLSFGGDDKLEEISNLSNLSKTSPWLALITALLMLSMAGIPPLAGFFAKFYIIYGAIKQEMYGLAVVAIISSVLATYYYLRFIKVMYFDDRNKELSIVHSISCSIIATLMALFNLTYVFNPSILLSLAQTITKSIFDI